MISILVAVFLNFPTQEIPMSTFECLRIEREVLRGTIITLESDSGQRSPPIFAAQCKPPCDCDEDDEGEVS